MGVDFWVSSLGAERVLGIPKKSTEKGEAERGRSFNRDGDTEKNEGEDE